MPIIKPIVQDPFIPESYSSSLEIIKICPSDDGEALTAHTKLVNLKGIEGALNDIGNMDRQHYLKQHPYEIYYSEHDKRYRTYVLNADGNRKPITSVSKENLENKIIAFYEQSTEDLSVNTFEKLYPKFLDYKGKETSLANANKLDWVWNTYFKGETIVTCRFKDITVAILKSWYLDKIAEHNLTSRKFKEMKSLMNMLYDYAIESNLLNQNLSRIVRNISYKKFAVERVKAPTEQVYVNDEEERLLNTALKQYEKTGNSAYLGICLNCTLALRVGEVVALKTSDFSGQLVHIQRQEIKRYDKTSDGKIIRNGYEIVPYGKTPNSDRKLFLTENAQTIFSMIVKANEQRGFQSEYLMLDKDGNRMKNDAINNVLRRLNRMIGTPQKGNHSIRKTCISNMGESKALTDEEIRVFAGHKEYTTTEKYYMHTTTSIEDRSDAYEKAINSKIANVFKRVQTV